MAPSTPPKPNQINISTQTDEVEDDPFIAMDVVGLYQDAANNTNTTVRENTKSKLPRIRVSVNGEDRIALVDSGATMNVIRATLLPSTSQQMRQQNLQLACGSHTISTNGEVKIALTIDDVYINTTCQSIQELNEEIILGAPFLQNEEVIIDFKRKCLHFGTKQRKTVYWEMGRLTNQPSQTIPTTLNIPSELRKQLLPVLQAYGHLFTDTPMQRTTLSTKHSIRIKEQRIINQRPYPMTPTKKRILYEQIQEMLNAGVIEASNSEYSFPPVIIERDNKKPRFCIDYRKLNEITEDDPSVLPRIPDNIKDLGNARFFTLLDLKAGYWQIPMSPESKKYTAFSTPDGALYHFTVMPFGLNGAPATFQRLMTHEVLPGYLHNFCKVYLDDVLIYSTTIEEHVTHIRLVLERMQIHNLHISAEKCTFASTSVDYLGYHIDGEISTPQEKHIDVINRFPTPKTKRQLQSFLGTINWVREYIPNVSSITQPLTRLLQKNVNFKWNQECQRAFEALKDKVAQPLKLHRPDYSKKFTLQTDSSTTGMACVLYHQNDDGSRHIISYASTTLNKTERKYHINELEALCVVWAIKRYRHILEDVHFTLKTDSRTLLWLNKHQDSKAKLTRWSLLLQEFRFTIEHCPGRDNQLPDFLSRNPLENNDVRDAIDESRMLPPDTPNPNSDINVIDQLSIYEEIVEQQQRFKKLRRDLQRWEGINLEGPQNQTDELFHRRHEVKDGLLWRRRNEDRLLIVPRILTGKVIHFYHEAEIQLHPGRDETIRQIQKTYYWRSLHKQVGRYIKNCLTCASSKTRQVQPVAPQKAHESTSPFEVISLDVLGPYVTTRRGNRYIFVAEDIYSKWIEAKPYPRADGGTLVQFLEEEIVARYGCPKTIISDNGPCFLSNKYQSLCEKSRIRIFYSAVEHQRANPVERRNQEVKKMLRVALATKSEITWDQHIHQVTFALRRRRNAANQETPSKVLLGYELPIPGSWEIPIQALERETATRISLDVIETRQKNYQGKYAPREQPPKVTFIPGDLVLAKKLKHTNRQRPHFGPQWTGPHPVIRRISDEVYEIDRNGKFTILHVDDLRPTPDGNQLEEVNRDIDSSEEESSSDEGDSEPENVSESEPIDLQEPQEEPAEEVTE